MGGLVGRGLYDLVCGGFQENETVETDISQSGNVFYL